MVLSLGLFDYCQAQPQLQLNWAEFSFIFTKHIKFADPQPEFADPQLGFWENIFLSSQSKDFHQI